MRLTKVVIFAIPRELRATAYRRQAVLPIDIPKVTILDPIHTPPFFVLADTLNRPHPLSVQPPFL